MSDQAFKLCTKCDIEQPSKNFSWSCGRRRAYCKSCQRAYNRSLKERDPDYFNQACRESYARDPERYREKRRAAYWENPEQEREKKRQYDEANRELVNQRSRENHQRNPEINIEKMRLWREAHKEEMANYRRLYREQHRQEHRDSERNRKAGKRANGYEKIELAVLYDRDDRVCYLCLEYCAWEDATVDHKYPLVLAGSHTYDNVALAHRVCNCRKGSKILERGAFANGV